MMLGMASVGREREMVDLILRCSTMSRSWTFTLLRRISYLFILFFLLGGAHLVSTVSPVLTELYLIKRVDFNSLQRWNREDLDAIKDGDMMQMSLLEIKNALPVLR